MAGTILLIEIKSELKSGSKATTDHIKYKKFNTSSILKISWPSICWNPSTGCILLIRESIEYQICLFWAHSCFYGRIDSLSFWLGRVNMYKIRKSWWKFNNKAHPRWWFLKYFRYNEEIKPPISNESQENSHWLNM